MRALGWSTVRAGWWSVVIAGSSACAVVQVPPTTVPSAPVRAAVPPPIPIAAPIVVAPGEPPLTLETAIARAVARHPALAAQQLEVRAREADAAQASRPPNPSLTAEVEDIGRTAGAAMPTQTTVSVANRLELGDKRMLRTAVAALDRDNAQWDLALLRADIEGRAAAAFVNVLAATAHLDLAQADATTAGEVAETVRARVSAGVAAPPESDRADAAAATARVAVMRALDTRRAALIALTSTWGAWPDGDMAVAGSLSGAVTLPALAAIEARLTASPAMARWATETARRTQALALARAQRIPDVDVAGGYRRLHETGTNALVVGATVALPWLDKRTDAIAAAQLRADAAKEEAAAALLTARELVATAHAAATTAAAALAEFDQRVIPLTTRAYEATLQGYRAGRFPLVDVLDARRALTAGRRERLQALADLQQSFVTLQRLVGETPVLGGTNSQGVR